MPESATKRCPKCRRHLPLASFNRDRTAPDGLEGWCRSCRHPGIEQWDARKAEARELAARGEKRCTKCGDVKPLADFNVYVSSRDGRAWRCRACTREIDRAYRQANRDAVEANKRRYRNEHPEWAREQNRRFRERHGERIRERERQRHDEWRAQVFAHYGTECACCGTTERLTIDHVHGNGRAHRQELTGRRNGGGGTWFYRWLIRHGFPVGYQTLCQSCNRSKSAHERCTLRHDADGELALDLLRQLRRLEGRLQHERLPHGVLMSISRALRSLESAM